MRYRLQPYHKDRNKAINISVKIPGCPSPTDSEVNKKVLFCVSAGSIFFFFDSGPLAKSFCSVAEDLLRLMVKVRCPFYCEKLGQPDMISDP